MAPEDPPKLADPPAPSPSPTSWLPVAVLVAVLVGLAACTGVAAIADGIAVLGADDY